MEEHYPRRFKYYEVLDVDKDASQNDINHAFRRLAKLYHPDANPDPDAHEYFKSINQAYQILSNTAERHEYDEAATECPSCGTHKVARLNDVRYTCRVCGHIYNPAVVPVSRPIIRQKDIPADAPGIIALFMTTQCSWCVKYYEKRNQCPYPTLHSNCKAFVRLDENARSSSLSQKKWWHIINNQLHSGRGAMARCRLCGALNPTPEKLTCWSCNGYGLTCPNCNSEPILEYNIDEEIWVCPNKLCGKKFAFSSKKQSEQAQEEQKREEYASPPVQDDVSLFCPRCHVMLYYDTKSELYRCMNKNCQAIYTVEDIKDYSGKTYNTQNQQVEHSVSSKPTTALLFVCGFFIIIVIIVIISSR